MCGAHRARPPYPVVLGLLLLAPPVAGQAPVPSGATLLAQATVVTQRLGGRAEQPFFLTAPRAARAQAIAPTDRGAAAWTVDGNPGAAVVLSFDLPRTVTHTDNPTARGLPIAFPSGAARWHPVREPVSGRSFDPAVGTVGVFADRPQPQITVRLGGAVRHAPDTTPGTYTGAVTLTVFYL